jgi:hypothetical protein
LAGVCMCPTKKKKFDFFFWYWRGVENLIRVEARLPPAGVFWVFRFF